MRRSNSDSREEDGGREDDGSGGKSYDDERLSPCDVNCLHCSSLFVLFSSFVAALGRGFTSPEADEPDAQFADIIIDGGLLYGGLLLSLPP